MMERNFPGFIRHSSPFLIAIVSLRPLKEGCTKGVYFPLYDSKRIYTMVFIIIKIYRCILLFRMDYLNNLNINSNAELSAKNVTDLSTER